MPQSCNAREIAELQCDGTPLVFWCTISIPSIPMSNISCSGNRDTDKIYSNIRVIATNDNESTTPSVVTPSPTQDSTTTESITEDAPSTAVPDDVTVNSDYGNAAMMFDIMY